MVLAEVASKLERALADAEAADRVQFILKHSVVVDHTADIGVHSGRIHVAMKAHVAGLL